MLLIKVICWGQIKVFCKKHVNETRLFSSFRILFVTTELQSLGWYYQFFKIDWKIKTLCWAGERNTTRLIEKSLLGIKLIENFYKLQNVKNKIKRNHPKYQFNSSNWPNNFSWKEKGIKNWENIKKPSKIRRNRCQFRQNPGWPNNINWKPFLLQITF